MEEEIEQLVNMNIDSSSNEALVGLIVLLLLSLGMNFKNRASECQYRTVASPAKDLFETAMTMSHEVGALWLLLDFISLDPLYGTAVF